MAFIQRLEAFPLQLAHLPFGEQGYRRSGQAAHVTHVLLHGIGSGSGSWVQQLHAARHSPEHLLLAWDAPGYGQSTPVAERQPDPTPYAQRLWAWLDHLKINHPVVLVGHSLGALMAARSCLLQPARVRHCVLLAPAQGYGQAAPQERDKKLNDRLHLLDTLGPAGMAAQRGAAMLSAQAPQEMVHAVQMTMSQIIPDGYRQASYCLSNGTLLEDIAHLRAAAPISWTVASGSADAITPPAGCQAVAKAAEVAWLDLGAAGHACPMEADLAVNRLLGLPELAASLSIHS